MNIPFKLTLTTSLYLLLFSFQIFSVIIQSDALSIKRADGSQQHYYLLHDVHYAPTLDDARQLSGLLRILQDREKHSTERLQFLVEKPYSLSKFWSAVLQSPKTIMDDLIDDGVALGLQYTTFENTEIRAASLGALHALHWHDSPNKIRGDTLCDSADRALLMRDITVQSLFDEYHFYRSQVDPVKFGDSRIQEVVRRELEYLSDFFDDLVKNLDYLQAKPDEKVMFLAQRLYNSGLLSEQKSLYFSVAYAFAYLFDLCAFKRMIESDVRHIALVAGCAHTQHLADMITSAGGRVYKRYGMSFHCQPRSGLIPLNKDQLNIFAPRYSLACIPKAISSHRTCVSAVTVMFILSYLFWVRCSVA